MKNERGCCEAGADRKPDVLGADRKPDVLDQYHESVFNTPRVGGQMHAADETGAVALSRRLLDMARERVIAWDEGGVGACLTWKGSSSKYSPISINVCLRVLLLDTNGDGCFSPEELESNADIQSLIQDCKDSWV